MDDSIFDLPTIDITLKQQPVLNHTRTMKTNEPNIQSNWAFSGGGFYLTGDPVKGLPPGAYASAYNGSQWVLMPQPIKSEAYFYEKGSPEASIIQEVREFMGKKESYTERNIPWKRGILLHGKPGTGKSALALEIGREIIKRGGVVINKGSQSIGELMAGLAIIRYSKEQMPIAVLVDEFENVVEYHEEEFLDMVDGTTELPQGIIFVVTCNHFDRIPSRIKNRPSRFDVVKEIPMPSTTQRKFFLDNFAPELNDNTIAAVVRLSEGFSMAHLKEVIVTHKIFGTPVDESLRRARAMIEADVEVVDDLGEAELEFYKNGSAYYQMKMEKLQGKGGTTIPMSQRLSQ